jgi:hypothetical protein
MDTRAHLLMAAMTQACDDKIGFNPQSVPLTWAVGVKPLDRERAKRQ